MQRVTQIRTKFGSVLGNPARALGSVVPNTDRRCPHRSSPQHKLHGFQEALFGCDETDAEQHNSKTDKLNVWESPFNSQWYQTTTIHNFWVFILCNTCTNTRGNFQSWFGRGQFRFSWSYSMFGFICICFACTRWYTPSSSLTWSPTFVAYIWSLWSCLEFLQTRNNTDMFQ